MKDKGEKKHQTKEIAVNYSNEIISPHLKPLTLRYETQNLGKDIKVKYR